MWQSLWDSSKVNPFGSPVIAAACEGEKPNQRVRELIPMRSLAAASTVAPIREGKTLLQKTVRRNTKQDIIGIKLATTYTKLLWFGRKAVSYNKDEAGMQTHMGDDLIAVLSRQMQCDLCALNISFVDISCEFGSTKYFLLCGLGGILSCGITHTMVVPLDLVKCRIQVDPLKYKSVFNGFRVTIQEDGAKGLAKGWAPTFIGYSLQGLGKFGLYEVFKCWYSNILGEENSYLWRTSLYLAASASAEFFADIALSPMEAAKVQIQTKPGFVSKLREALPIIYKEEGLNGFYKSLVPLWMRQIPYTMMKFACFERTIELLYKFVVPKPRADCTKGEQLVVTFAAGYIAGVFCAIVSHPADTVVSKLNQEKGISAVEAAKKLGFAGLWKGLGPRIVMIGTLTAAQWFIYDAVKVWLRLPRPPPPEMPESLKKKLGLNIQ